MPGKPHNKNLREQIARLFGAALDSKFGVAVVCSDPNAAKQKLYAERARLRRIGITTFDNLTFRPRPGGELWIIKREPSQ